MWQAEVLQRQGSWVTRHETKEEATQWAMNRAREDWGTENPVKRVTIQNLDGRDQLLPPLPPEKCFDESWGV